MGANTGSSTTDAAPIAVSPLLPEFKSPLI